MNTSEDYLANISSGIPPCTDKPEKKEEPLLNDDDNDEQSSEDESSVSESESSSNEEIHVASIPFYNSPWLIAMLVLSASGVLYYGYLSS